VIGVGNARGTPSQIYGGRRRHFFGDQLIIVFTCASGNKLTFSELGRPTMPSSM